jgi:hypothetical protein
MILQFGKHNGKRLFDVPRDYLDYLLRWDKLKPEMRTAIEAVQAGTYVEDSAVMTRPRPAYEPTVFGGVTDIHDRVMKATRDGARRALADAGQEVESLAMPSKYKSLVLEALLKVAGAI